MSATARPRMNPILMIGLVVGGAIALALVALLISRAVSSSNSASGTQSSVEQAVASGIATKIGAQATVDCPESGEPQQGSTTVCVVTSASGTTGKVHVRHLDGKGTVEWSLNGPLAR